MKPRLLDLFSGAGGCAVGYARAGFEVVGVDLEDQPRYPFEFVQMDALRVLDGLSVTAEQNGDDGVRVVRFDAFGGGECFRGGVEGAGGSTVDTNGVVEAHGSSSVANPDDCALPAPLVKRFDAIHASPPCQAYSQAALGQRNGGKEYPDLLAATRDALEATGLPYVIENVKGAPLRNPVVLEGQMFGLNTHRLRLFEANWPLEVPLLRPPPPRQAKMGRKPKPGEAIQVVGHFSDKAAAEEAMGISWMTRDELAQAIPPAYTQFIGEQLLQYFDVRAAA